jgi:hypothetical protein
LDAASVQTAREASRLIVGMIKAHPTENRMPRQAILVPPFTCPSPSQMFCLVLESGLPPGLT